jgi:hypothetical protein
MVGRNGYTLKMVRSPKKFPFGNLIMTGWERLHAKILIIIFGIWGTSQVLCTTFSSVRLNCAIVVFV